MEHQKTNIAARIVVFFLLISLTGYTDLKGQDLSELLELESQEEPDEVQALFKSTRIINGHSIKQMKRGELDYRISHRFGEVNSGLYELYGMDFSTMHLSLEFGPLDWMMLGLGRGTFNKTIDGFMKFRLAEQKKGESNFPFSIGWMSSVEINTLQWIDPDRENLFSSRVLFAHQLLVARKMGRLTIQTMPLLVHRNLLTPENIQNDIFALGFGSRFKLTNRFALTAEYYYVFRNKESANGLLYNPLSIGFDIETGGHVFQLVLSNSTGMREGTFIGNTYGSWTNGGVHFGFNISRVFTLY